MDPSKVEQEQEVGITPSATPWYRHGWTGAAEPGFNIAALFALP